MFIEHTLIYLEVFSMSRTSAPIQIIVHYPQTDSGKRALAEQIASAHADMVSRYIQKLNCPSAQKQHLLDTVIQNVHSEKPVGRTR